MSGLFKSKKVEPEWKEDPETSKRTREMWDLLSPKLGEYISKLGKPYGGELVSPLTGMERQSLGSLQRYLDSPYASQGREWGMAEKELGNIFGDTYDPWRAGGPIEYTQRRLKKYLGEELLPMTRHQSSMKNAFYSSGLPEQEQGNIEDVMDQLAQYAYGAEENMISRRERAIPTAMGMASAETDEPLNRLLQSMGLAGYERTQYDQPKLTAEYLDMQRLMQELGIPWQTGMQLSGQSTGAFAYPGYRPSPFEQFVLPTIDTIGNFVGNVSGGGGGGGGSVASKGIDFGPSSAILAG